MLTPAEALRWRPLLQVDSDDTAGTSWGDAGCLLIGARRCLGRGARGGRRLHRAVRLIVYCVDHGVHPQVELFGVREFRRRDQDAVTRVVLTRVW
ncbi:hypothetical protein NPS01_30550 [Nocardioides psychrotolerans]|uniref:Uncharacterized protein n=1 Tax=Nocardioides psychrotolerans TaxID=1005945 RepID=A0A1I3NQJ1_9ACTN|nr:DUF1963 domain-containing protein [Nocardioides psychrotolerans]GEP39392.1 hypothetical protein NPS01_30550 [Nocardioides psychrotolerans]SFJ11026.1 hypothetical protein SAMN05216561_11865 [Nocardioides psychrotolerans]